MAIETKHICLVFILTATGSGCSNFTYLIPPLDQPLVLEDHRSRADELLQRIESYSTDINARFELVWIYLSEFQFASAEHHLRMIIEIDSRNAKAHKQLAIVLSHKPEPELKKAIEHLKATKNILPKDSGIISTLALIELKAKHPRKALVTANEALSLSRNREEELAARLVMSSIYFEMGSVYEAQNQISESIKISPSLISAISSNVEIPAYPYMKKRSQILSTHPETGKRIEHRGN